METTKRCATCEEVKPVAAYSKRHDTKDGLQTRCKICYIKPKPDKKLRMYISEEGYCVNSTSCLPHKDNRATFIIMSRLQELQEEWIDKHNCFVSRGRVYADVVLGSKEYIIDAVTGTLYHPDGDCVNGECDLMVDLTLIERDKTYIREFVCRQH